MNTEQRKLVVEWLITGGLFLAVILYEDLILEHWDILMFPFLIALFVAAAYARRQHRSNLLTQGSKNLNDVLKRYPIVKWVLVLYGLCIAVASIVIIQGGYDLHSNLKVRWFLAAFSPLLLPVFVVQCEKYKRLGKQSNNRLEEGRG